jgi:cytochrome P450
MINDVQPPAVTTAIDPSDGPQFDPLLPETFDSSHPVYEDFRQRCPVAHSEQFGGFWALFKYRDVVAMAEDWETYVTSVQNVVPKISFTGKRPPLHIDPPEHIAYRRPLNPVFRTTNMRAMEVELRRQISGLLDNLVAAGGFDFARDLALPFAAHAFARLLDLDDALLLRVRKLTVQYNAEVQAMNHKEVTRLSFELYDVAREIVAERKADPRDPSVNLVSGLLRATHDKREPISEEMVVATIRQMLVAAIAAPHAVMGSAVVHLARDQALQAQLRSDPTQVPAAVEEFLRMYSPYRVFSRTPVRDVELGGQHIGKDEPIAMIFPSANRDEEIFESPHEFRLNRNPNPHIAFGVGTHRCPAAPLARLELRVMLEELLAHTDTFRLDGDVTMMNWLEFGPSAVPLLVDGHVRAGSAM